MLVSHAWRCGYGPSRHYERSEPWLNAKRNNWHAAPENADWGRKRSEAQGRYALVPCERSLETHLHKPRGQTRIGRKDTGWLTLSRDDAWANVTLQPYSR